MNTVLAGIAMDGKSFFYVNPLEVWPNACMEKTSMEHVKPVRQKWFGCACCPPNIARTLASLGEYICFTGEDSLWINLLAGAEISTELKGKKVKIRTYRGFESKVSKVAVKFKIKYSCKGMENVKLKKGKKNKIQVANMGKDITFVPEGEIFKKTKGKNRFKGWHIKRKGESNKNRIDFKFDKKKKKAKQYPENMGNVITLYPVFG